MIQRCLAALVALSLGSGLAYAHHSWAGFDQSASTVEGVIDSLKIENPHTLIELHTADNQRYTVVWGAINALRRQGLTLEGPGSLADRLRRGDRIVVTGRMKLEEGAMLVLPLTIEHKVHGIVWTSPRR